LTEGKLPYWGFWKGNVIKAISVDGARSWQAIQKLTKLPEQKLNKALAELFTDKVLYKDGSGGYSVRHDLSEQYRIYFDKNDNAVPINTKINPIGNHKTILFGKIDEWKKFRSFNIDPSIGHFFVEGDLLDDISKYLIVNAEKEILVTNPFVEKCSISDSLIEACKKGKMVRLITRPIDPEKDLKETKKEYHELLKDSGVEIIYNKSVHGKLVALDRAVSILSSMNFYSGSSAGASWETGIVTFEEKVVRSIVDSILKLLQS